MYVVCSKLGHVTGPFPTEESAISWAKAQAPYWYGWWVSLIVSPQHI